MTRPQLDVEGIRRWAKTLSEESLRGGTLIVVEGRRDIQALVKLGVRARFITVVELAREMRVGGSPAVCGKRYVILTDFDSEGRRIRERLESELSQLGATIVRWPVAGYLRLGLPSRVEECSSLEV